MASAEAPVAIVSTGLLLGIVVSIGLALVGIRFAVVGALARWRAGRPTPVREGRRGWWARGDPLRLAAQRRFPQVYGLASARVGVGAFTGLPLTLVAIAALALLAMFIRLVDDVRDDEGVVLLDRTVDDLFGPFRAPWLLRVFLWITAIGAGPCLAAVLCCATALLLSGSRGRFVLPLWIAFLGAQATTWSSKYIIDRPRPAFLPHITEWNPSFPSGHSTASTALIGMLGYVVACSVPGWRARFDVAFSTTVLVGLVCLSRLFLGVHFLSDVLAGIAVGTFWLLVGVTVANLRAAKAGG